MAIGSNKQKEAIIDLGLVPRFLQILDEFSNRADQNELLIETTATINSLAKGTDVHSRCLIEAGTVPILLSVIMNPRNSNRYIEISLKTLRSLFNSPYAPLCLIYEWREGSDALISRFLELAASNCPSNFSNQEAICNLLAKSIESEEKQKILASCGAVLTIGDLLSSPAYKVQVAALNWLAKISHQNGEVSRVVVTTTPGSHLLSIGGSHHQLMQHGIRGSSSTSGSHPTAARRILNIPTSGTMSTGVPSLQTIPDILSQMMSQERSPEMQMMAAKCMTYIFRSGQIAPEDKRIVYKTLPTLIRCCKKDKDPKIRVEAAEALAYLTEVDTSLQQHAQITDQIIPTIGTFFKYLNDTVGSTPLLTSFTLPNVALINGTFGSFSSSSGSSGLSSASNLHHATPAALRKLQQEIETDHDLKAAGFKVFASLGSQDEEIRKKIFETDNLMDHLVSGLSDSNHKIRFGALKCLHSLSRSVQQNKTNFADHAIWSPLKSLLSGNTTADNQTLILASSTLCNLLLEYSPSKQHFMERSGLELLCNLTQRDDPTLRINGVWALMNMVYKADQAAKLTILNQLGMDKMFRLLNDSDVNVVMKTLGLLRNLLSNKPHIDHIMTQHGKEILDAILMILDAINNPIEVKEQALCVLANIADGDSSKEMIMNSEDMLMRLKDCLEMDDSADCQMVTDSATNEPIISITLATSSSSSSPPTSNDLLQQNQSNNNTPISHLHHHLISSQNNNLLVGRSGSSTSIHVLSSSGPVLLPIQSSASSLSPTVKLQVAATFCITNLAWADEEGSAERQKIMREIGIYSNLTKLLQTPDTELFDKVKTAHSQFARE